MAFVPSKGKVLRNFVTLSKEFEISLDFHLDEKGGGQIQNMIRMANVEGSWEGIGTRIPLVSMQKLNGGRRSLRVFMAISGNPNSRFEVDIKENKWYTLRIFQKRNSIGEYFFKAYLDEKLFANQLNEDPQLFENVKIFASDSYTEYSFNGLIRNFKLCTEGAFDKECIRNNLMINYIIL